MTASTLAAAGYNLAMEAEHTEKEFNSAMAELLKAWLPLLDGIGQPDCDDSKIAFELDRIFSNSPLGHYWANENEQCPEPLLIDIVDVFIGMDNPNATPNFPWETYESIHGPRDYDQLNLSREQLTWHHRRQAWMYVRTLVYALQVQYLPESIPPQLIVLDPGTSKKP